MQSIAPPINGFRLRLLLRIAHLMTVMRMPGTNPGLMKMPVEKRASANPAPWMLLPMPDTAIERGTIDGRTGPIPVKRFLPHTHNEQAPQILFIHGGGWVAGGVDSLDYLCTNLCDRVGWVVTAVGYRLAPEHPFPAALEDCEDVLEALAQNAASIVVVGDSAGGNLGAALSLKTRGKTQIRKQVLIYPMLDATLSSPSWEPPRHGMRREDAVKIAQAYCRDVATEHPLVSPLLASDLTGLPPTLLVTADADPLRDDGIRFADRLREAGVPVRLQNYMGMPHGFLSMASLCPAAPECIELIVGELNS